LSSNYFNFLDNYFITDLPASEFDELKGFERINRIQTHVLNRSKVELTGQVKDLYLRSKFSSIVLFLSDTAAIDSMAKIYEVRDYGNLLQLAGTMKRSTVPPLDLQPGDTIPNFFVVNVNDSLESLRDYSNRTLYINLWATWCGPCIQNIPELNKMVDRYRDREDIAFLNICVDSERDNWMNLIDRYKLKGHNLFASGSWNEKLRSTFNMKGVPAYVLVDKNNVLYENHTDKAPSAANMIDAMLE
jgi:thiol-disulfide isomerase/thioredoxin